MELERRRQAELDYIARRQREFERSDRQWTWLIWALFTAAGLCGLGMVGVLLVAIF